MTGVDALVIGGGFYGCRIALCLREIGFRRVSLIEREAGLMRRASFVNQARVHNGYHYPRSLPTALSSQRNFRRFVEEHAFAITTGIKMIYAIARDSKINGSQFARFCAEIGAPCRENPSAAQNLFDPALIEARFGVEEIAFDATLIAEDLSGRLAAAEVDCRFSVSGRVAGFDEGGVSVETTEGPVRAQYVFNCTYASLRDVGIPIRNTVKKELAEIALIEPPRAMAGLAVTVMDGPFFSSMPFPALSCYSLTHVRYTPHVAWTGPEQDQPAFGGSRAEAMMRDAARYMPCMRDVTYLRSLYELKAVLVQSERSDSRPIVFEYPAETDRVYSVLGSKIDNIYDVLAHVRQHPWAIQ